MKEIIISLPELLSELNPNMLIIMSPSTRKKTERLYGGGLFKKHQVVTTHEINYDNYLSYVRNPELYSYDNIVGIGGGTAIDLAKFLGLFYVTAHVIAVPSMLSTNAFATNKVAAINKGVKHTIEGIQPNVCIDRDLLELSSQENLWGLVDTLSIFTALKDWDLANKDTGLPITKHYQRAQDLLNQILNKNYKTDKITIDWLYDVISESGFITNDYGSGRPESGSEHIFASTLETSIKIPHALAVSLGIGVMSYYMGTPIEEVTKLPFNDLGVIHEVNNRHIPLSLVYDVIQHMKPRADKYTYVNSGLPLKESNKNDIKKYLNQIGFNF